MCVLLFLGLLLPFLVDAAAQEQFPQEFNLIWSAVDDGEYITYDQNGVMQMTPADTGTRAAGTIARCTVNFILGGDDRADPGEIEIRLPRYIFKDRNGKNVDELSIGVPKAPDTSDAEGYNYYIDEDTDEIVITNWNTIEPAAIFTCEFDYYSGRSMNIKNGYSTQFDADLKIDLDGDGGEPPVEMTTPPLALEYHTWTKMSALKKSLRVKYERWQPDWGEEPENSEDYFYMLWQIYSEGIGTQPFCWNLTDIPGENMEVVGWAVTDWATSYYNDDKLPHVPFTTDGNPKFRYPATGYVYKSYEGSNEEQRMSGISFLYHEYVLVLTKVDRKAVEQGQTEFDNSIRVDFEGQDTVDSGSDMYTDTRKYDPPQPFAYKGDTETVKKNNANGARKSVLTKLEAYADEPDKDIESSTFICQYDVGLWSLTLPEGKTVETADYKDYGKREYTIELSDDLMALGDDVDTAEALNDEDFSFQSVMLNLSSTSFGINYYEYTNDTGVWKDTKNFDYDKWKPLIVQYKTARNGEWHDLGYIRATSSGQVYFENISGESSTPTWYATATFPKGTKGWRVLNTTNFYHNNLSIYTTVSLKPTKHVLDLIKGKEKINLYNFDTLRVFDSKGEWADKKTSSLNSITQKRDEELYENGVYAAHNYAYNVMAHADITAAMQKTVTLTNNPARAAVEAKYLIQEYASYNNMTQADVEKAGLLVDHREGTFYELLPQGMTMDVSTLHVWTKTENYAYIPNYGEKTVNRCEHTLELVENWRDSGRTMAIIRVTVPSTARQFFDDSGANMMYGLHVEFTGLYSWDSVGDFGNNIRNSLAFKATKSDARKILTGYYPDDGAIGSGKEITDAKLLANLDENRKPDDPNDTIYAECAKSIDIVTSAQIELTKKVKAASDTQYSDRSTAIGGGAYSYQIRFGSLENSITQNMIAYDVIEGYEEGNAEYSNRWYGIFDSVDTSQPEQKGIDVKIYYSTLPRSRINLNDVNFRDLENTEVWSDVMPADKSKITAISFDLRKDINGNDYELPEMETISLYINMKAPLERAKEYEENNSLAYNTTYLSATLLDVASGSLTETQHVPTHHTQLAIKEPRLEIHKSSDPESGTEDDPTDVINYDPLNYDIYVSNKELAESMENVVIQDNIPEGLEIDSDNIMFYSGTDSATRQPISESSRIKFEQDGQMLRFKITTLAAGETMHFLVPTQVASSGDTLDMFNTAYITSVNSVNYNMNSETTYHEKLLYTNIAFKKVNVGGEPLKDTEFEIYTGYDESAGIYSGKVNTRYNGETFGMNSDNDDGRTASGEDGLVVFAKMSYNTDPSKPQTEYYIRETKAADGYRLLLGAIKVRVGYDGRYTISYNGGEYEPSSIKEPAQIINMAQTALPLAGDVGVAAIYFAGAAAVWLAAFGYVRYKRRA